jgi:ribosome-associated protein
MIDVKISTEFIKLDQFLKWAGAADSGLDAKMMINEGLIKVNDIVEYQRGKKLRKSDIVEVKKVLYKID